MAGINDLGSVIARAEDYDNHVWANAAKEPKSCLNTVKAYWNGYVVSSLYWADVTIKALLTLPSTILNAAYDAVYAIIDDGIFNNRYGKERFYASVSDVTNNVIGLVKGVAGIFWIESCLAKQLASIQNSTPVSA